MNKLIKRFIKQHCLGYSDDFLTTYTEAQVEFEDGSLGTVWTVDKEAENGYWITLPVLYTQPYIARPLGQSK